MYVRPALWSVAIQAAGSAATVAAALLVTSQLGLGAQGQFGLLRSWNDALTSIAVLGLPQSLLHLQYRENVPVAALRDWVLRYVAALAVVLIVVASVATWHWPTWAPRLDETTLRVLAAAVPLAAVHLLCRSLLLRNVGIVRYALITALPSLLILVALVPICLAAAPGALVWALLASAAASALAAAALVCATTRGSTPAESSAPWSRRMLWSVGIETGGQNVLTAFGPALMLSTASVLGASLTEIGLVSLGLYVYLLFGVAAAYAAPQVYDRAARTGRHIGARELLDQVRRQLDRRALLVTLMALSIVVALITHYWPASPWLLVIMAVAGAVSMWGRLLTTLMLARGAFRPLTYQALGRLVCGCGGTVVLMQHWRADTAVPLVLLATELLMLAWLVQAMRRLDVANSQAEGRW